MKRMRVLLVSLLLLMLLGMAFGISLAQEGGSGTSFQLFQEIGRALPQRILYDPNFERLAVVDAYGRLLLLDGLTYETQHILYQSGAYNDINFSHDGRWLALAVGTRIELWDAENGTLAADLTNLSEARRVHGPMAFSPDDRLLLFFGTYPAPPELRRSENDTITVPWLWNLPAARDEENSTFAGRVEALPFFDYRNGFVIGPENRVVAALPGRLQVLDGDSTRQLFDIETARYEQDPLRVWFSQRDNRIYVRPNDTVDEEGHVHSSVVQVDTQGGVLVEFPLNEEQTLNDLETLGSLALGSQARVIGPANSINENPLLAIYLGRDYNRDSRWDLHPLTVTLIDVLVPPATDQAQLYALLFVYDELAGKGWFILSQPRDVQQIVTNPAGNEVMMRRVTASEQIEVYDLDTGRQRLSLTPALRDLGYYSPAQKNRVLSYDRSGSVIVSDFQRFDAETGAVLAEDLRYSRVFERFFVTDDSQGVVTLSGNEWRLWSITTGELLQRTVLQLRGNLVQTWPDGTRFLTRFTLNDGTEGVDVFDALSGERRSVLFQQLPARNVENVIPSPDWEHFLVTYTPNSYGPYAPGNEAIMYNLDTGLLWYMAGDDMPQPGARQYGWADNETVYVYGELNSDFGRQPARGSLYDCLATVMPDRSMDEIRLAWDMWTSGWSDLQKSQFAWEVCQRNPDWDATPVPGSPGAPAAAGNPGALECALERFPTQVEMLAEDWRDLTEGLSPELTATLTNILCEGLETVSLPRPSSGPGSLIAQMVFYDVDTGERASGFFADPPALTRPIGVVEDEFWRTEGRTLGTAILSPDGQLVLASSLPGELVVYRLLKPYETLAAPATSTAIARVTAQNLVSVFATPTPTPNIIGTLRPTLTPTITPTGPAKPFEQYELTQRGQVENLCPANDLYDPGAAPGYTPLGRLIAPIRVPIEDAGDNEPQYRFDSGYISPATGGTTVEDTLINRCGPGQNIGVSCTPSPDLRWLLIFSGSSIFTVHPDGSEFRTLFGEADIRPDTVYWTGSDAVEYTVYEEVPGSPGERAVLYQRDILGQYPDPTPWRPEVEINGQEAEFVSRQPGGSLAVVRFSFNTGLNTGYEYYLYNYDSGEATYFARLADYPGGTLTIAWHPTGEKLYYHYPTPGNVPPTWLIFDWVRGIHTVLGNLPPGSWSPDGRYRVFATQSRAQQVAVWDSETGLSRTYCIPETGARLYDGAFYWSPDSRYLALQTTLPADESNEDIGAHILILDTTTGYVTDLIHSMGTIFAWLPETIEGAE